jgi:hypothetical protein
MKKMLLSLITAVVFFSLAHTSWAITINGELVKVEGSSYIVKDAKGKEHKIHFDDKTKKTGDIKAGVHVEVDEEKGHAKSIKAMEVKK